jgi:sigma-E factor negative regulatory protein RseA
LKLPKRKQTVDQNQDKMPETRLNEALSALMDGEADELEVRRILRELPANPELYAAWKRYHSLRASLQQEVHVNPRIDLLDGVRARLATDHEATGFTHQSSFSGMLRSRVVRYLGQGAIAASVAAAALIGVSMLEVADNGDAGAAAVIADAGTTPVLNGTFNAADQTRTVAFSAEEYSRLEQAVLREFAEAPEQTPVSYEPEFPVELTPAE